MSPDRIEPPVVRPRRLRTTAALRRAVAETSLEARQLVLPVFVREGSASRARSARCPASSSTRAATLQAAAADAARLGLGGIMLFGIPEQKDATGSGALDPDGVLNRAIADVKAEVGDALPVMADLCLDEFTDHGHCGVLDADGRVDNDATLERVRRDGPRPGRRRRRPGRPQRHDGRPGAVVREALDGAGHTDVAVLAYSAKYASAFFGPFREAVDSSLAGRPPHLPAGPRQRPRGRPRGPPRRRRGRRHRHGQAGPGLPRRPAPRPRRRRRAGRGLQHLGRVRHGRGRRRQRLDRPRAPPSSRRSSHPARRRRHRADLLGGRGRRLGCRWSRRSLATSCGSRGFTVSGRGGRARSRPRLGVKDARCARAAARPPSAVLDPEPLPACSGRSVGDASHARRAAAGAATRPLRRTQESHGSLRSPGPMNLRVGRQCVIGPVGGSSVQVDRWG